MMATKPPATPFTKQLDAVKKLTTPPPALLIISPDQVRRQRLLASLFTGENGWPSLAVAERKSLTPFVARTWENDLPALSLFSKQRLIIASGADELKAEDARSLVALLERAALGTTTILVVDSLPERHALRSALSAATLELPELRSFELLRWTERELHRCGITTFEKTVPERLAAIAEEKPDRIASLADHLALYLDGQPASEAVLQRLFGRPSSLDEYKLLDLLVRRKTVEAIRLLRALLNSGMNHFLLLGTLSRAFSSYHTLATLVRAGVDEREMRTAMGSPPWLFQRQLPLSKQLGVERARDATAAVVRADSRLKHHNVSPDSVLDSLVLELTA